MKKYYIYMMTTRENTALYIGVTGDLERRVAEHRTGLIPGFTKKYKTVKLVYVEEWNDVDDAIKREKQLKGWVRNKKNELIGSLNPTWEELLPWEQ